MKEFPDFDNCSTIIVGKNASKTGRVIMAHNEDDPNCVVQVHLVPRIQHKPGEVLVFDDANAVIPQVEETWAYYWSEVRSPNGESFADGFANEWGVVVATNGCAGAKVPEGDKTRYGIGYALRRLIAERAKTAREGVEIAARLIDKYGYISSRSYQICDKDEGWVFQVTTGHNYVARRVGDDEIYYIPNWYTIHQVDFGDTEHKKFYFSKDLVNYPMTNGWYTPAKEGDYSDFDFADAYQVEGAFIPSNFLRSDLAWSQITGKEPMPHRTFSIKAERKYGVEDLKPIMRSHYAGHREDLKDDPTMSPHRYGICRDTTIESMVVEFADTPELTCVWRACPRPCASPYIPWYLGINKLPKGYEWTSWKAAQRSHLTPDPDDFKFKSDSAYWAFHMLQNLMEFDYQFCREKVHSGIADMESYFSLTKPAVDAAYTELSAVSKDAARQLLTDYTCRQAQKALDWAVDTALDLVNSQNAARMNFWRSKL